MYIYIYIYIYISYKARISKVIEKNYFNCFFYVCLAIKIKKFALPHLLLYC